MPLVLIQLYNRSWKISDLRKRYTNTETVNRVGLLVYAMYPGLNIQSTVLLDMKEDTPLTDGAQRTPDTDTLVVGDAFLNVNESFKTVTSTDVDSQETEGIEIKVSSISEDASEITFSVTGIVAEDNGSNRLVTKMGGDGSSAFSGGLSTVLIGKEISIESSTENSLWLNFDSSWVPAGGQKALVVLLTTEEKKLSC